jgi:hypothetical protein
MQKVQNLINAYYEEDVGVGGVNVNTPADDVDRLSNQLSTFPKCVNEHLDSLLIKELSVELPEDDIEDLTKKHDDKCAAALEEARKAIIAIEKYTAAMKFPHLFTKDEINDLSDEKVLALVVGAIIDMYGEEQMSVEEYLHSLLLSKQRLDNTLLEFKL